MKGAKTVFLSLLVIFILAALTMSRQLFSSNYFSCFISDTYQYASWSWQFREALKEGISYPGWAPLNFWGYGSPTFILYPPLTFYLVALFDYLTGSLIFGMTMTKFISLFVGAAGTYFLAREIYSGKAAFLAGAFYAVFPFHVSNLYMGGGLASAVSLMWLPWIFVFLLRYTLGRKFADLVYSGAAYGGLIFTHLINAYMFAFMIIGYFIFSAISEKKVLNLAGMPVVLLVGGLVSAAYLVPLLSEWGFFNNSLSKLGEAAPYRSWFVFPKQGGGPNTLESWQLFYDEIILYLTIFIIIALLMLRLLKAGRHELSDRSLMINKFLVIASFVSAFVMTRPSAFIWEAIPFFKYINIAIRWLNITAFCAVLLSACGMAMLLSGPLRRSLKYLFLALIFSACSALDVKYIVAARRRSIAGPLRPTTDRRRQD